MRRGTTASAVLKLLHLAASSTHSAALPVGDQEAEVGRAALSCSNALYLDTQTNIWTEYALHPNRFYVEKVKNAAAIIGDAELRDQALRVADVGTFLWIKSILDIEDIDAAVSGMPCDHILGLVLDNLPHKRAHGCKTAGPAEEYDLNATSMYQTKYIDAIADKIKTHPDAAFAVIVEPSAFPGYFVRGNSSACQQLGQSYRDNVPYALRALSLPNVITYLDVGHGGSMNWNAGRNISAKEIISIYEAAGRPLQLRGFATNVANWNSWDASPGEFTTTVDVAWSRALNEKILVTVLSDALKKNGMPARATHAVVDTGRNGVIGVREAWEHWCNVDGAGLGRRPSAEEADYERMDAFVWAKPPGESDGTSNPASPGYSSACGGRDAFRPAPEVDDWNQAYFEMLVRNARPPLS